VRDTGVGIAEDDLPHLFEPFNRLSQARSGIEGTGIGLAIVRRAVERMGGQVGVVSQEGKGARFWVRLRCAPGYPTKDQS